MLMHIVSWERKFYIVSLSGQDSIVIRCDTNALKISGVTMVCRSKSSETQERNQQKGQTGKGAA